MDLLDKLHAAESAPEAEVLAVLGEVMEFTAFHFAAEEILMAEVGYPELPTREMTEQHREFKDYARLRVLEFRLGEMKCVGQLHRFLDEWLKIHEFRMDRLLADWIRAQSSDLASV